MYCTADNYEKDMLLDRTLTPELADKTERPADKLRSLSLHAPKKSVTSEREVQPTQHFPSPSKTS